MAEPIDVLKELSQHGDHRASLHELIHCLMFAFGGPSGLARHIYLDFEQNQPGSANRIKIEMALLGMLQNYGSDETDGIENEEVLEALARQIDEDA